MWVFLFKMFWVESQLIDKDPSPVAVIYFLFLNIFVFFGFFTSSFVISFKREMFSLLGLFEVRSLIVLSSGLSILGFLKEIGNLLVHLIIRGNEKEVRITLSLKLVLRLRARSRNTRALDFTRINTPICISR